MRPLALLIGTWMLAAGPAAAARHHNHCEIAVSGDVTASIKADVESSTANNKVAAGTEQWSSDAEIRAALVTLQRLDKKRSDAENQRWVDARMKLDPRIALLILRCLTDDGGVIIRASILSKTADFPMKPATYAIKSEGTDGRGEFHAKFSMGSGGKRRDYLVQSGKLVLTQFDRKGVAGTYTFKAIDSAREPKHVEVTGTFSYACVGDRCRK
jgi:hypothetical protein